MPAPKIKSLTEREAIQQIVRTVKRAPQGEAPFALVLGSGFSHGLVPVSRELITQNLPLWVKSLEDEQSYDDLKQLSQQDRDEIARKFWREFIDQNGNRDGFNVKLDPQTNLPENYAEAYQAAFDPEYDGAVNNPKHARDFQRALMQLNKPRLNAAHFLLASLLGVQPGKTMRRNNLFRARAAFSRLILTTNFDPFLQIALQAVNQLYFMSDTPRLGVSDEIYDDQSEAIHLVYLHGSVHRRDQAATKAAIDDIKKRNATILAPVLERHGVIVLGYSGWDDAIVEALLACDHFDNRLYWCGLQSDPLESGAFGARVPEILQKHAPGYIRITSAGSFMVQLYSGLVEGNPRLLENPIGQLRELLDIIDLKELEDVAPPASSVPNAPQLLQAGNPASAVVQKKQSTMELLIQAEQTFFGTGAGTGVSDAAAPAREARSTSVDDSGAVPVSPVESKTKVEQLFSSAQLAVGLGNFEEGLKLCNEALTLTPLEVADQARLLALRAFSYLSLGKIDEGLTDLTAVIELPGAPTEQLALASALRGAFRVDKGETDLGIEDYTRVIDLPDAPVQALSIALLQRATTWERKGDTEKALADYDRLIDKVADAPPDQLAAALNSRSVILEKIGQMDRALADYTSVIELPGAPAEQMGLALLKRGLNWVQKGEPDKAIADYSRVIEQLPNAPVAQLSQAFFARATVWASKGETEKSITDYTEAIERMPDSEVLVLSMALIGRGDALRNKGEVEKAIADYTRVIDLPAAPIEQLAQALNNRGFAFGLKDEKENELADYTRLIELPDAPVEQVARALINRGFRFGQNGENEKATADYTRVVEMPGAPVDQVAQALYNRGVIFGLKGENQKAIGDYTLVSELSGAPVEQVAQALNNRGVAYGLEGENGKAIADYTQVSELSGAPVEQVAQALNNRGVTYGQNGEPEKELADYTRVIELPGAPADQVARALINRAVTFRQKGEREKESADYTQTIELPGAPVELVGQALAARGWNRYLANDFAGFLADTEAALKMQPAIGFALFNLGLALLASGRDAEALVAYRAAGEQFPQDIDALGLDDLKDAGKKWLTEERAQPVIQLLESLKK